MTTAPPLETAMPAGVSMNAGQLVELIGKLVAAGDLPRNVVVRDVLRTIMKFPSAVAVSYFQADENLGFCPATPLICRKSVAPLARDWEKTLTRLVIAVGQSGQARGESLNDGKYEIAAAVVGSPAAPEGVLTVFTSACQHEPVATLLVQLIAEKLSPTNSHRDSPCETRHPFTDLIMSLDAERWDAGFQQLANSLRRVCKVDTALVGTRYGSDHRGRLRAISGNRMFRRPSPTVSIADELLSECLLRSSIRLVTRNAPDVTTAEVAFFDAFDVSRCVLVPARTASGRPEGAVILAEQRASQRPEALKELVSSHASSIGQALMVIGHCQPTKIGRFVASLKSFQSRKHVLWLVLVAICGLMIPVPDRVTCDSELRTVTRRFVAAPYDGRLRDVLVQPGDLVEQGQVLACMDRREVDLQLATLRAQRMGARKRRDTSLAMRERAEAQISKLEMEQLDAQIELLEARAMNLEIKAPIAGIILAGDPKDLQGARIELGQTLFETGPVERMLAELWVAGADIAHVTPGQTVQLRLDAHPHRIFRGEVKRVGPRAEIRDSRTVFLATVRMDNEQGIMRPGMAGRAKVATGYAPLIWRCFRKPLAALARFGW